MKNILFIKIGALGDLSFALPAAKMLKNGFPCHVTWIVGKSYHTFLKGHSFIDELIVIDDKKFYSKNIFVRISETLKLIFRLRKKFDSVVIAHRDKVYYQFFKFFAKENIFQLVRDKKESSSRFVTVTPMTLHETLAIKKLISRVVEFYAPTRENAWQWDYSHIPNASITLPEKFIILHLGGGVNSKTEFTLKCWPHWESLILQLLTKTELNLVFVGSPAEVDTYKKIEEKILALKTKNNFMSLIGKLSIPELVNVIRRADLFVGIDSGPLHIADSLDKKTIGLFGPTSTVSWGLLSNNAKIFKHNVSCSPCYKDDGVFPDCQFQHRCMKLLAPEIVFDEIINKV